MTGQNFRKIRDLQTPNTIHGVKAAIDDLNYACFKAKEALSEELKTDVSIQNFFKHVYPANTVGTYTELFGNPESAVIRKRFTAEVQCPTGGFNESIISIIDKIKKGTFHSVDLIPAQPKYPTFMGIPLTIDPAVFIPPFN